MNRSKARWRMWGLAVMWDAGADVEPLTATVAHVVHHYLPVQGAYPGIGGLGPDPRVVRAIVQDAITEGNERNE